MTLSELEINEKIEEDGMLRVLVTFEVAGKPAKHVDNTLDTYIDKLKEDKAIHVLNVHREDVVELEDEDGFFSAFAEVEMLIPDLESLTHLSVNLMPASVEVLAPDEFHFEARNIQNWSNDLLSRLHEIAQEVRTEKQKSAYLNKNIQSLLQNMVTIILSSGPKPTSQLSQMTGVKEDKLTPFLKQLEKKGSVQQEGDVWTLSSSAK